MLPNSLKIGQPVPYRVDLVRLETRSRLKTTPNPSSETGELATQSPLPRKRPLSTSLCESSSLLRRSSSTKRWWKTLLRRRDARRTRATLPRLWMNLLELPTTQWQRLSRLTILSLLKRTRSTSTLSKANLLPPTLKSSLMRRPTKPRRAGSRSTMPILQSCTGSSIRTSQGLRNLLPPTERRLRGKSGLKRAFPVTRPSRETFLFLRRHTVNLEALRARTSLRKTSRLCLMTQCFSLITLTLRTKS